MSELSPVPGIYAKRNVLSTIERDGNKEYDLTYYTQVVETIARRFMTHEPCPEHENDGNLTEYEKFKEHYVYRITD
jgi:hypothetical protein